ncbi:MAG TPA: hypothetical protein GX714_12325 [Chloroflexi bacterium]|nr:hypothetical protein [Chloroflexota bacterium]
MRHESATLPLATRVQVLAKVFQSIPLYFAHWESSSIPKDGLDDAFEALLPDALAMEERRRFSLLMTEFLARFNNGHTGFRDPRLHERPPLGVLLRPIEGRWTIVASNAAEAVPGDVVLAIEDQPVEAWYDALLRYTAGSPQSRTVQFADLLRYFVPDRYTIRLEDASGAERVVAIARAAHGGAGSPQTEGRLLAPDLAYIKVPSFARPHLEQRAVAYVHEFRDVGCLILDVRGNPGGSTPGELTKALMNRAYHWWMEHSPLHVGLLAYQAQRGLSGRLFDHARLAWRFPATEPDADAYPGRLVILVDRATLSAAEDLVMPFKDNGRALLIGETTGGSTGQPFTHTFANGMSFAIGTKRASLPDGGTFEGVGIAPDIAVEVRRRDLYARVDPVLERAMRFAREG